MWQRLCLVMLVFAGCERERTPTPTPTPTRSWWCWVDSVCFTERSACEIAGRAIEGTQTCVPYASAFCSRGCEPTTPDKFPSCGPRCGVDRYACELQGKRSPCRQEPPPLRPELFEYSTPGFWCYSHQGPYGDVSWCMKDKAECEWTLDDTLAKLGRARESLGSAALAGCVRPTTPVYCWSRRLDGKLAFVCVLTKQLCDATRANAGNLPVAEGHTVTDFSDCAPWAYD